MCRRDICISSVAGKYTLYSSKVEPLYPMNKGKSIEAVINYLHKLKREGEPGGIIYKISGNNTRNSTYIY